jgi:YVTN family beta-propeller protein
MRPLPPGAATWNEEDSRANFNLLRTRVVPGNPDGSRLLRHPLAEAAGGDPHHDGGKHWLSKDDPEWRTLAAWVRGATLANPGASAPGPLHPRIIQTNSAGDDVHIIDPATNKVVGHIVGIEASHGVAVAPDGGRIYISSEAAATLDVVDARTLRVMTRIPLSGDPNNIAISRDGKRRLGRCHRHDGAATR